MTVCVLQHSRMSARLSLAVVATACSVVHKNAAQLGSRTCFGLRQVLPSRLGW